MKNFLKKSLVLFFSLLFITEFSGGNMEAIQYLERADYLLNKIFELYFIKEYGLFKENFPSKKDDKPVSYLWPFSGLLSALTTLIQVPNGEKYKDKLNIILEGLEKYWDDTRFPPAYQSYPKEFGGGDRFYDDNLWVGLDLVDLYNFSRDKKYLEKAKNIFKFALSGWSEDLGGGIFWCEQNKITKNTCSNGPFVLLSLKLYEITNDKFYLDWGTKAYNWTKNKLQAPEGVFWDNINLKGNIDRRLYPYNSGTMLHSSVLLYKITKDERYLKEAQRIAKASFNIFTYISKNGERFFYKHPWFVTILFRGYLELYKIDNYPEYINTLVRNINYAWENAKDEYGLIYHDWSGEVNEKKSPRWLLHEACMVELYARITLLKLGLF
jgi:hypothetical protein